MQLVSASTKLRQIFYVQIEQPTFQTARLAGEVEIRGNAGRPMRPQPRVQSMKTHASKSATVTAETPGIPRAMVLTAYFALPGDRALLPPSFAENPADLNASVGASGPHDFAVRLKRIVSRAISVHRIPPHVRDDRETPLTRRDDSLYYCFYPAVKIKF